MAYPNTIDSFRTLKDFVITTLASDVSPTDTTIYVTDTSSFPDSGYAVIAYNEIIYYTSKTSTTLEGVSRGQLGTTAGSFSAGEVIYHTALSVDFSDIHSSIQATQLKAGLVTSTPPSTSSVGDKYIDPTTGNVYIYNGTLWVRQATENDISNLQSQIDNFVSDNTILVYLRATSDTQLATNTGVYYYGNLENTTSLGYNTPTIPAGDYYLFYTGMLRTRAQNFRATMGYRNESDGSYIQVIRELRHDHPTADYETVLTGVRIYPVSFSSDVTISPAFNIVDFYNFTSFVWLNFELLFIRR